MPAIALVPLVVLMFSAAASAAAPKLTIYDDGRSCPANCDAHVVFHPSLNGTKYAHAPGTTAPNLGACGVDSDCEICFEDDGSECITTKYRGSGPGRETFDLTPAFYEAWCSQSAIPTRLNEKCDELRRTASSLSGRINCIKHPEHHLCETLMNEAVRAKNADTPLYTECRRQGQSNYNEGRPAEEKRAHACGYEFESNGGPNSRGLTWRRLLPGACREGTFVGRDGLDCCSGREFIDAALGRECRLFYPPAPE